MGEDAQNAGSAGSSQSADGMHCTKCVDIM